MGLARKYASYGQYNRNAVTPEVRAPEFLFGASEVNTKVDVWSAGCVMAFMFLDGRYPFKPQSDMNEYIFMMWDALGVPREVSEANGGTHVLYTTYLTRASDRRLRAVSHSLTVGSATPLMYPAHPIIELCNNDDVTSQWPGAFLLGSLLQQMSHDRISAGDGSAYLSSMYSSTK